MLPHETRTMQDLVATIDAGKRPRYLFFWGHTPKGGGGFGPWWFSQWYPSPFEVEGVHYATAEHWMMAEKARLFGDEEHEALILQARSPAQAKKLGRAVRGFAQEVWEAACFEIVVRGSVHKFAPEDRRDFLLDTRRRVLVEASPPDRVWGIGLDAGRAAETHPSKWRGRNLLGFALMEARERLAAR